MAFDDTILFNFKELKMLAGIIGDVLGSVYEAHQWQRKDLPLILPEPLNQHPHIVPLFKENKWVRQSPSWTDDTLCTLALYSAFLTNTSAKDNLLYFCNKYKAESIGFGGAFMKWLENPVPYQSFGNGSLMRVGFFPFLDIELKEKLTLAYHYTAVSHDHTDSFESVRDFIFIVDKLGNQINEKTKDKSILSYYLTNSKYNKSVESLHQEKKFELNAKQTLLQAIVVVLESNSMEDILRNSFYVGGDSDTLACIACNLASKIYPCPPDILNYSLDTLKPYPELDALTQDFKNKYWK